MRAIPYTAGRRRVSSRMRARGPRRSPLVSTRSRSVEAFELFLIKPSHYDDDGYVIQWWRSSIPANTLATLNGLALDCAERRVLGDDVEIRITVWDETNTRIRPEGIIAAIRAAGGRGLVGLVGVQTNQFPRAVDIARPLRAAGIQVCIGGFHVSGCVSMLPDMPPELKEAMDLGITLFAGEAEGRLEELLLAAYRGELKPLYNFMNDLPGLEGTPMPYPAARRRSTHVRAAHELRRRPRLPVPLQLLHHHQRPGPQVARAQRRRRRADRARQPRAGRAQLLHHRRQHRAQPELGGDLRPPDRDARGGGPALLRSSPRSTRWPQDPGLHREGGPRRRQPRVHRAREHQPRIAEGRQEGPEPHHRVPHDAAGVAQRRRAHLRRLHPRLPGRHAGHRSSATSASSSASCRSTSWSSSSSRRSRDRRTTRSCISRAWRWSAT